MKYLLKFMISMLFLCVCIKASSLENGYSVIPVACNDDVSKQFLWTIGEPIVDISEGLLAVFAALDPIITDNPQADYSSEINIVVRNGQIIYSVDNSLLPMKVRLFDILGRFVFEKEYTSSEGVISLPSTNTTAYLLFIQHIKGENTYKLLVQP